MSESTQLEPSPPPVTRDTILLDRLARIRAIRGQLSILKKELRQLTGGAEIRSIMEAVNCLRCGYAWVPNNPFSPPTACARCGSTAWDKPPTESSRKPEDPARPWWKGRRQSRKGGPKATLRFRDVPAMPKSRQRRIDKLVAAPSPFDIALAPPMTPPPAPEGVIPPPPAIPVPMWAANRMGDEPQPEIITSHVIAAEVETEVMPSDPNEGRDTRMGTTIPNESGAVPAGGHTEPASVTSVEDIPVNVPAELVGAPQTDAEREELARAREEAWPTTRPDN